MSYAFLLWRGFIYSKAQEDLRAPPPWDGGGGGGLSPKRLCIYSLLSAWLLPSP
jgi:hypothetical protein